MNNIQALQNWVKEHGAWNKSNNYVTCKVCRIKFYSAPANKAKFCSKKCYYQDIPSRKGENASNWKGGKPNCLDCGKQIDYKSIYCSRHSLINERSYKWKGNKVGYRGLHLWIEHKLGKPTICEFCKREDKKLQWANKSHEYKRDLEDWIRLCIPCHKKYDGEFKKVGYSN